MENRDLFRAKKLNSDEWVEGNIVQSIDAFEDWKAIIIPVEGSVMTARSDGTGDLSFENWYRVDPETVSRCTGQPDKNGKLVFENEILMAHLDEEHPEYTTYITVEWNGRGFVTHEKGCTDREFLANASYK